MKFIAFCFLFFCHISYASFFLIEHNVNKVHITATFDKSEVQNLDGQIKLYVPETIWGTPYYKQITNITSNGTYDPQTHYVSLEVGQDLRIEYDVLCATEDQLITRFSDHYDHFISQERFYLMGIGLFITPPLYNDKVTVQVSTNIPNVAYSTHPYFYQNNTMNLKVAELDKLIIVASNDLSYHYQDNIDVIMWSMDQDLLKMFNSIAMPVFSQHEGFWLQTAESTPERKLSIVIKAPIPNIERRYGGTVIGKTILFFIVPENTSKDDLTHLVKHENIHFRIGKVLSGPQWFIEGFTEYYVDKIDYHYNKNWFKFVDIYNTKSKDYFSSLAHFLDDQSINDYFFKISQVERIPYIKGYVIAGQIDSVVDLDGVLKNMIYWCKTDKTYCKFTPENFFYAAGNILSNDQQQTITNIIKDINSTPFNQSLGQNTKLNFKKQSISYFGTDVMTVWKDKVVWGKDLNAANSNKYDETINYKVIDSNFDFETGQSTVTIQNGEAQESVNLPPISREMNIPFYSLTLQ